MLTTPNRLILLALLLLTAGLSTAEGQTDPRPATGVPRFDRGRASVTLPAKFTHAHILLQTTVNGKGPFYLALDTGASYSTLPPGLIGDVLKLETKTEAGARKASYVDVTLQFPGLTVEGQRFLPYIDYMAEEGTLVSGILGFDFIGHFVLEIDYFHQTVTLYDPKTYRYSGENDLGTQTLPITLEDLSPHLDLTLRFRQGGEATVRALVDTGAGGALVFTEDAQKRLNLHATDIPAIEEVRLGSTLIHVSGWGTHPPPTPVSKPPYSYDVLLGNEAFENMKVVFDYANKRMITAFPFKKGSVKICCE